MTTARENLVRVFRHERPDWIPIVGHVDPYNQPSRDGMDPQLAKQLGDVKWSDQSTLIFSRYLGLDVMDYVSAPLRRIHHNVQATVVADGLDTVTTWHTPLGELRDVQRRSTTSGASYVVDRLVKTADDLPAYAAIFADETFELDPDAMATIDQRRKLIGDDGMLTIFIDGTPLGRTYRTYTTVEDLAYLYADAPDALGHTFDVIEENHHRQFALLAQCNADAFIAIDDTSTTVISPAMFERYSLDYTNRVAAIFRDTQRLYIHHSCGLIKDLLPLYRQTAMDGVHAFTVPPIGDVTVAEGRRLLGDRITIMAGLAPLALDMSDQETAADTIREMFEQAAPGDHFIMNVIAYPDKTMAQTAFAVAECKKHQRPPRNRR